ncbi:DUF2267 domain-containing protein [Pleurocapsales cyanobacterium LEGE 06147]|nr:DUF2267 domain-containing protein [Pleurocapsales cyanobacterium LEGE 06147]
MSATGLEAFDRTLQKTHILINEFASESGVENKHLAFKGLLATLHALRDRITVEEAVQLGSQLPVLLAGFYYQGWKPGATPTKERSVEDFLNKVRDNLSNPDYPVEVEQLVRSAFKTLSKQGARGEIEDIAAMLPKELQTLLPEEVRA